jgi:hypothetical protein
MKEALREAWDKLIEADGRRLRSSAGRAIDRAAKLSGHPKSAYRYVDGRAILK